MNMYSQYYQSIVDKNKTWFVIGILKSEDNLAFVRTLDKTIGLVEYFVPLKQEPKFLKIMEYFIQSKYVSNLEKKENRLKFENLS